MRRLVTAPFRYLSALAGETAQGWNRFFFTPADPTALGVTRVVIGALLFWNLLNLGWDLRDYLGSEGWIDPAAVRQYDTGHPLRWSLWWSVPDALLRPAWVACLVVTALYTIGLFSRVTAVLAWVIVVSWVRRAPVALFGFDQAVSTLTLYLAVTGASGQAVSLDRFLERWKLTRGRLVPPRNPGDQRPRVPIPPGVPAPTVSANLALRLIQLHFCLIYGMAGLAKLQGGAWWGGMAIWGMLASAEFRVVDFNWLVAYPLLLNVLTHAALALEIGYPALIWVRPIRPLVLALVVVLHVGIAFSAPGLTEFAVAMIAGNLAFVSGEWLRSLATGVDPSTPAATVLYDGGCPRCRASIALVSAADPGRVIDPVDLTRIDVSTVHSSLTREACMRAMQLVNADGRVHSGYDAVVRLARGLPMFWPAALFGSLPGVTWAGRRAYNAIAASRPRDQVCNDEVCGIHPHSTRGR